MKRLCIESSIVTLIILAVCACNRTEEFPSPPIEEPITIIQYSSIDPPSLPAEKTISEVQHSSRSLEFMKYTSIPTGILLPELVIDRTASTWPLYNEKFQSSQFRFRIPPSYRVYEEEPNVLWLQRTFGSSPIALIKAQTTLSIWRVSFPDIGELNPDEQFAAYYYYEIIKPKSTAFPDISSYQRYKLKENTFLYTSDIHPSMYNDNKDVRIFYAIINGYGLEMITYQKIPKNIVYNLINTVEFTEK